MDFVVKKEVFIEELKQIFDEQKAANVFDSTALKSKDFVRYVCLFQDIPLGYAAVYPHANFMEKEGVNVKFKPEPNSVYIWHVVVKKAFEGKGVASLLIDSVLEDYVDRPIYSVIEEMNTPSIMMHSRAGFKPFAKFKRRFGDQVASLVLMKRKPK